MGYGWGPAVALNIVGFPNCLDPAILGDILAGGADKVKEAGAVHGRRTILYRTMSRSMDCACLVLCILTRYSRTMDADRETFLY